MNLHSKYTDYQIIYKDKDVERLEHITDSNLTIRIDYYESSQIQDEWWFLNGKLHRENGPAYIAYNESGNITSQHFFLNGILYTYKYFIQTSEYQVYLKRQSQHIFD